MGSFLHFPNSQLCSLEMLVMPMFRVARSSSIILVSYSWGFLSFKPYQYGGSDTSSLKTIVTIWEQNLPIKCSALWFLTINCVVTLKVKLSRRQLVERGLPSSSSNSGGSSSRSISSWWRGICPAGRYLTVNPLLSPWLQLRKKILVVQLIIAALFQAHFNWVYKLTSSHKLKSFLRGHM